MACAFMQQYWCKNITSIFLLHNRLPLAYIHQIESDLPPTSYSVSEVVKNCISIGSYNMLHWQLMRMCVLQKEDLGRKKKHVISRYRACDLLTWSQQLFWHDHANILPLIRARSPTDTYIHTSKRTEISPPNSLVWGSLRLAPINVNYREWTILCKILIVLLGVHLRFHKVGNAWKFIHTLVAVQWFKIHIFSPDFAYFYTS